MSETPTEPDGWGGWSEMPEHLAENNPLSITPTPPALAAPALPRDPDYMPPNAGVTEQVADTGLSKDAAMEMLLGRSTDASEKPTSGLPEVHVSYSNADCGGDKFKVTVTMILDNTVAQHTEEGSLFVDSDDVAAVRKIALERCGMILAALSA